MKITIKKDVLCSDNELNKLISQHDFANASRLLLELQKNSWSQLSEGYKSLKSIKTKEFHFNGFTIRLQFNPGRIISTSAKVDENAIKERKCFLCYENLPDEQKGILYNDDFLILCNPFPIFPEHFTTPHINHFPQEIKNSIDIFLELSKDLSSNYIVFYNGPKCGASAPDHLHFQAGNKFFMPIDMEYNYLKNNYSKGILRDENISIYVIDDGLRRFVSFESKNKKDIVNNFHKLYSLLISNSNENEEPKMNIISSYEEETGWKVIVFLREKHRSSHFFAEGESKILLSPAAVDLGGVCITPLENDFNKITKDVLIEIFNEVSFNRKNLDVLLENMKDNFNSLLFV